MYRCDLSTDMNYVICHSGDGTMGVFNIKRRRFELLSEFQSGDLTSVAIMKVSVSSSFSEGSGLAGLLAETLEILALSKKTFRVNNLSCPLFPALSHSEGRRWCVAPVKGLCTSSTGTALEPPVTASL
jgi:hypothetical protein